MEGVEPTTPQSPPATTPATRQEKKTKTVTTPLALEGVVEPGFSAKEMEKLKVCPLLLLHSNCNYLNPDLSTTYQPWVSRYPPLLASLTPVIPFP